MSLQLQVLVKLAKRTERYVLRPICVSNIKSNPFRFLTSFFNFNLYLTLYVKVYVRETSTTPSTPFVSMAEMMKRFQSSTRDLPLQGTLSNVIHGSVALSCLMLLLIIFLLHHRWIFEYFLTN